MRWIGRTDSRYVLGRLEVDHLPRFHPGCSVGKIQSSILHNITIKEVENETTAKRVVDNLIRKKRQGHPKINLHRRKIGDIICKDNLNNSRHSSSIGKVYWVRAPLRGMYISSLTKGYYYVIFLQTH